jgi:hypothetical protein
MLAKGAHRRFDAGGSVSSGCLAHLDGQTEALHLYLVYEIDHGSCPPGLYTLIEAHQLGCLQL